jgi:hypothetical protein
MATKTGVVIQMYNYKFNTPNKGILLDADSGLRYEFNRPSTPAGYKPHKWNVKVGDVVTYDLTGGVVTGVELLNKSVKGVVYS